MASLTENRLHRVWIVDEGEHPVGVVTLRYENLVLFFVLC